jgi:hypothetical protein
MIFNIKISKLDEKENFGHSEAKRGRRLIHQIEEKK